MEKYAGPAGLAPVHWKPGNGLESGLVRPDGFDVYQPVDIYHVMAVVAPLAETIALVGAYVILVAHGY